MIPRCLVPLLALPALLAACPGPAAEEDAGELVVGVQAEELGAIAGEVHVVTKVDGAVVTDETVVPGTGALPKEIALRGAPGARAEVHLVTRALGAPADAPPLLVRDASARIPARGKRLLRLQLQPSCATLPALGGVAPAPSLACAAPLTCAGGRCVATEVPDEALEPYAADWAKNPPDVCKPIGAGAPELVVGTGMTDYAPLADGQVVALERGPQGGHHVWVAVRMKNLRQSGSMTTIRATVPDDPSLKVPDAAYVFTYDRDEGSYCKLWGLRFQVDASAADLRAAYKPFLGKRLAIAVEVVDQAGARASATRTIQLAPQLLCPDGTTTCATN